MFNYDSVNVSNGNERVQISTFETRHINVKLKLCKQVCSAQHQRNSFLITSDITKRMIKSFLTQNNPNMEKLCNQGYNTQFIK